MVIQGAMRKQHTLMLNAQLNVNSSVTKQNSFTNNNTIVKIMGTRMYYQLPAAGETGASCNTGKL